MSWRIARLLAASAALVGLPSGCSKPASTGVVSGAVKLDGVELKTGQIRFVPVDGQSATAGAVIVDGRYRATVPFGEKSVEITSPKEGAARKMYDAAPNPAPAGAGGEAVPARYNARTELKMDVRPGDQQHDFDLTSADGDR